MINSSKKHNPAYFVGDVNGDGRADAVCIGNDGSLRVWEAQDGDELYTDFWTSQDYEFCVVEEREVRFTRHYLQSTLICQIYSIFFFQNEAIPLMYNSWLKL